jgi:threonine/homoserine/homoserine lactone efflux protein
MFGIENVELFIAAAVMLNLTPGQDTMYIIGQSLARGRVAGVWSALGISVGSLLHTIAAAFGLSAILAASATAFEIVKWAGAVYLVYLGARMIFERRGNLPDAAGTNASQDGHWDAASFRRGVTTNVLNPKVAVFFLAFLPQFVSPTATNTIVPFLILGATFIGTGTVWCLIVAFAAARFSARARSNPAILKWVRRLAGGLFIGLGLKLAFSRSSVIPV